MLMFTVAVFPRRRCVAYVAMVAMSPRSPPLSRTPRRRLFPSGPVERPPLHEGDGAATPFPSQRRGRAERTHMSLAVVPFVAAVRNGRQLRRWAPLLSAPHEHDAGSHARRRSARAPANAATSSEWQRGRAAPCRRRCLCERRGNRGGRDETG